MPEHSRIEGQRLRQELSEATGNDYSCCYQCGKCTAGCPAGSLMDNPPTRIMRLVQAGMAEEALKSDALWYCVGCMTCTARCPQNMDIAGTMDALRSRALKTGIVSDERAKKLVTAFHTSFLQNIRKHGRLRELSLVGSYKLRTRSFLQDAKAGLTMLREGKINPLHALSGREDVQGREQIEAIFRASERPMAHAAPARRPQKQVAATPEPFVIAPGSTIGYYPGCSLGGTAKEYDISVRRMCGLLGLKLQEIPDWNCCGATSAHATSHKLSLLLPARNQALADAAGMEYVLAPCAACQNRQVMAQRALREDPELCRELKETTGMEASGKARFIGVTQLLEAIGTDELTRRLKKPLSTLTLACYYGCLLVRPIEAMQFDDLENPMKMEAVLEALGAATVDWSHKIECCGAGLTLAQQEMVEDLTHAIARNAAASGAKAFAVACPLCHANLDMRQEGMRKRYKDIEAMPVYYISELVAIALGADPEEVAVGKHFVPALDMLRES
ncbi:heterodisulfide reductase-related iron-sulfur binding cluster [Chlorobium sp. N1]|uniref:heterodisulfide reductase-related iron-sulfur binding cluster n=1 Tax=Chlorobium sp. N1 TaxID=2491138 RepID=UPI001039945A|nr:heterodisulfide reductase-related iron-sulfur binding cluster [Chlorobium sp. N1]TCD47431.1 4Fe-4S dicluster domain-containing protein [Chlorobium sp. N1]